MSVRVVSPPLAEKARLELNEEPIRLKDDLLHLKDWIAKQPHLQARTDDQWLLAFLRGCKFSLERTKEKLDLYYTIRTTAPDLFKFNHTDAIFQQFLNTGALLVLPKTAAPDAPRVMMMRPGRFDPEKYNIMDSMSTMNILQKILFMDDDHTIIAGTVAVIDLEGVSMGHLLQMTPATMKKMVVATQDATPVRMKGVHYLNTPKTFETLFSVIKSLLNEKNRNRLHVHSSFDDLFKYMPKEILPTEYGGNAGTTQEIIDYWKKKVTEYDTFLVEDIQYCTDESKRPGKPRTAEDLFGAEGSFRKLEVD